MIHALYIKLSCFTAIFFMFLCQAYKGLANSAFPDTTLLGLVLCPGETSVEYMGTIFELGDVEYFTFTSSTGADSVVKVSVFQSPVLDFWATTSPICRGSSDGVIEFWDNVDITAPYLFSLDGGLTYADEYTYTGLPAGFYELRAKNKVGCVFEYELTIPEHQPIMVQTRGDVVSCADSVRLDFTMTGPPIPHTFWWEGGGDISSDSVFWAKTPGNYLLTIANECDTVHRTIKVKKEIGHSELSLFAPNAFSPNGDGINDCFRVFVEPFMQFLEYQLLVFDRWGGEVFRAKNIDDCWDGLVGGKDACHATFIWQVTAKQLDCYGEESVILKMGEVTLLR